MRETIVVEPYFDKIDIHIVKIKDERYKNLKFGINYRVFDGEEWVCVVRYDNHLHKGKFGKHLHRIDKDWENPEYIDMNLKDARKFVENLGKKLRKMVVE